jgi:hypothetical protein
VALKVKNVMRIANAIIDYLDCFEECEGISRDELKRIALVAGGVEPSTLAKLLMPVPE